MQFKQCCVCGLNLPLNVLTPIQVSHQGKIIVIPICDRCKQIKEAEVKKGHNEITH